MHSLLLLMLWMPYSPTGGAALPQAGNVNVVRICSPGSAPCQDYDARALEPAGAGQVAFIDPETLSLVQPTQEESEALFVSIEESLEGPQESTVQTLPDGTLKLIPGKGFTVFRKAVLQKKEAKP